MRRAVRAGALWIAATTLGCGNSPTSSNEGKSAVASVSLLLDSLTTVPGAQLYGLGVQVVDTLGQLQPSCPVTWTSSDSTRATVDTFGSVHVLATGSVNIIAAAGGHADTLPIEVVGISFAGVAAGVDHACGLTTQHGAVCWGTNGAVDRLGLPDPNVTASGPVAVQNAPPLVSVVVGSEHSCGVTATGTAYCWGANDRGQLGDGHVDSRPHMPTPVSGGLTFTALAAGYGNTCGISTAGAVYCWGVDELGRNGHGGDGSAADDSLPVAVSGGLVFTAIAVGLTNTCGITTDSTAYCWGDAGAGEVGAFPLPGSCGSYLGEAFCPSPVPVGGGLKLVAIAAGSQYACGVASGGQAYCWGINSSGSTGDTLPSDSLPFAVPGGQSFSAITTTATHTCALTTTGQAYCWGVGGGGELGNGATASTAVPQAVTGALTFTSISAGLFPTCAVTPTGVAYCWGQNINGALGVGGYPAPIAIETTPTKVLGQ
jgi:alpha-tubulin suppressor-like RCC1 family protein